MKWAAVFGGINEITSNHDSIFTQPLTNQPGEKWEYGISMDWAGLLIERVTKQTLADYFQTHIFAPLGIKELTFFPSPEAKNLAHLHQRHTDGSVSVREGHLGHVLQAPLHATTPEAKHKVLCAGGHGLFGTPADYTSNSF